MANWYHSGKGRSSCVASPSFLLSLSAISIGRKGKGGSGIRNFSRLCLCSFLPPSILSSSSFKIVGKGNEKGEIVKWL